MFHPAACTSNRTRPPSVFRLTGIFAVKLHRYWERFVLSALTLGPSPCEVCTGSLICRQKQLPFLAAAVGKQGLPSYILACGVLCGEETLDVAPVPLHRFDVR